MYSHSPSLQRVLILAGAFGAAGPAAPVHAAEFSWQLSGGTAQHDTGNHDSDSWSVDGTYYLDPIDDGAGPFALASFLDPTTRLSAAASGRGSDTFGSDYPTAYTLTGFYVLPGAKWYVGAHYSQADVDDDLLSGTTRSDPKGYGVVAGRYLGSRTTLELGVGASEQSSETQGFCPIGMPFCVPQPLAIETTTDSLSLDFMHVRQFRSLTYSLQARVARSDTDVEINTPFTSLLPTFPGGDAFNVYSVGAELFPTSRLGVRLGYSRPDGRGSDTAGYELAATWYFKPRIAVQFAVSRATFDDVPGAFDHADTVAIRFIGRL